MAMRLLACAALVVFGCFWAVPANPGDQKPRLIASWGEVIDPVGDCKIEESSGVLSITVPGKHRDLNPLPGWNNLTAPRVLQDIDGDFVVQVLARKFEVPKKDTSSNKEKPASYVGGGILLWQNDKNFLRFFRAANGDRNDVFVGVELFSDGVSMAAGSQKTADENTYLRVTRKKGKITLDESKDGAKWQARVPPGKPLFLDGKAKVGIALVNATTREITHQFEKLQVDRK
jgi:hypothetical protein